MTRLLVRGARGACVVLPTSAIDFAVAQGNSVTIKVAGSERLRIHRTLTDLLGSLDPARFVRVHRSYVVNIDRLRRIDPYGKNGGRCAVTVGGLRVPIARGRLARLRAILEGREG